MHNPTMLRLQELLRTRVVNIAGCDVGEIEDMVIDLEFQAPSLAILSCTGIVGKSGRLLGIPFRALAIKDSPGPAVLMVPDCVLKLDEGFDRKNWPPITREWVTRAYNVYGVRPYWVPARCHPKSRKQAGLRRSRDVRSPESERKSLVASGAGN